MASSAAGRRARLSVFGSIPRDDFGPGSDVGVLVEFLHRVAERLFDIGGMLMELRQMLGREVAVSAPGDLSRYIRDGVLATARLLYAT